MLGILFCTEISKSREFPKTFSEYMFFNQTGDISTRNGISLKLVDKFTYLGRNVSSTEADITSKGIDSYR